MNDNDNYAKGWRMHREGLPCPYDTDAETGWLDRESAFHRKEAK